MGGKFLAILLWRGIVQKVSVYLIVELLGFLVGVE
jgi:hypothetical protein